MRHPHADLIHAYAEGAEIEWLNVDNEWEPAKNPGWYKNYKYRIKPKNPEWYENIPPHGVLCWVRDDPPAKNGWPVDIIKEYLCDVCFPFIGKHDCWQQATPLTNEEIQKFLRSET